LKGEENYKD
jgi:hypothetical protein